MKAIIKNQVSNARNYSGEKETVGKYVVLAKTRHCNEVREIVDCRVYMGRSRQASTVYASLWVHAFEVHTSGSGSAGGWGYHKESAAIASAITSAGVELYGSPYGEASRWNHDEQREYTIKELTAIKRKENRQRCYIGGCGDSAVRLALEAIARAAGARGPLIFVSL